MLRNIFLSSLVAMLLITWFTGYNVGFNPDEIDMNGYGRANIAYYASGGKDTSCLGDKLGALDPLLRYYGSAFEYIAVGFNKITGLDNGVNEFNSRHVFNQLLGILTLLFAGLIAHRIAGWRAAIFAAWLAFLSPAFSGHFYFNTKDIPFAFGYTATIYYILRFLQELPAPSWKTAWGFMLSLYFAINIRIGGLMLLVYLFLFAVIYILANRQLRSATLQHAKAIAIKVIFIIGTAITLTILTWPYLLMNPLPNLLTAINVTKKFPLRIYSIFDGAMVNSLNLPPIYLPKLLLYTTPLLILALVATCIVFLLTRFKTMNFKAIALVIFAVAFPVAYAIFSHAPLYCGWRHFLFIYPSIAILAAIGLNELFIIANKVAVQAIIGVACIIALASPTLFALRNMPYQYTYFNELAGGFKNAYYTYDTDYWMISGKKSVDWLMQNEPISQSTDTVFIATNMATFVKYYIHKHYPKAIVKVMPCGVIERNTANWSYAIFNSIFVKPEYLENCFPLAHTVYSETIEDLPVTSVLKDPTRLEYKGISALWVGQLQAADSLLSMYLLTTNDKNNPSVNSFFSVAKAYVGKNDDAIALANRTLMLNISLDINYNCYCALGVAYTNKNDFAQGIFYLKEAIAILPNETNAKQLLQQVLEKQRQSL